MLARAVAAEESRVGHTYLEGGASGQEKLRTMNCEQFKNVDEKVRAWGLGAPPSELRLEQIAVRRAQQ